jgi:polynucleotide 5'-hydroxyl-kinase GRC3/NOL9
MEIQAPKEWHDVLNVLEKEKGTVILLGTTDTGKSTLAKFLVTHLCKRGVKVAFVDADIGQSFLGPPTAIGLS